MCGVCGVCEMCGVCGKWVGVQVGAHELERSPSDKVVCGWGCGGVVGGACVHMIT